MDRASTLSSKTVLSVLDILNMSAAKTAQCCLARGLSSSGTLKSRQVALIEHVTANRNCVTDTEPVLAFSKEPTDFVWKFSKAELKCCDAASKAVALKSNAFVDKNGCQWTLLFYPKGNSNATARKASFYLALENMKAIGATNVHIIDCMSHVESGLVLPGATHYQGDCNQGYEDFMDIPDLESSECPICLEQVPEKLATECGHAFCAKCTVKMLTESARIKCPLCRRTVARSDELVSVRYSALESFTLKITFHTTLLEKDMSVSASLGDVVAMSQSMERKLSDMSRTLESKFDTKLSAISEELCALRRSLSGSKRNFSQMNAE